MMSPVEASGASFLFPLTGDETEVVYSNMSYVVYSAAFSAQSSNHATTRAQSDRGLTDEDIT